MLNIPKVIQASKPNALTLRTISEHRAYHILSGYGLHRPHKSVKMLMRDSKKSQALSYIKAAA